MSDYNFLFKIILTGNADQIREHLFHSINPFQDNYRMTIGVDFGIKVVEIDGFRIKFQIWNPSNQLRFSYTRPLWYRGVTGVLLVTDQSTFPTSSVFFQELLTCCGPVPINYIIHCSPQFIQELEHHRDRLRDLDLIVSSSILQQSDEIFLDLAHDLLHRQNGGGWSLRLTFIPDNIAPFTAPLPNQPNTVESFIQFLEEQVTALRSWTPPPPGAQQFRPIFTNSVATIEQLELFHEILESMGVVLDKTKNIATIHNNIGEFNISLLNGSVNFIPKECFNCAKKCESLTRSLCIIQDSYGWSNLGLFNDHLLILAKIFAIQTESFPSHVWNQIHTKKTCHPLTDSPHLTISGLRDAMLRELRRLKQIMRGDRPT